MPQPTQSYVDPSIAGNSGAGTIGDPWGDVQYGLDQVTRDSTDGDRFNILTGTDEILAAALSLTTYGTPTGAAPLIFQGYTTAAEDGGIGGISGNGSLTMFAVATLDFIQFKDMHLHNSGSATILNLDNNIKIDNCEIDNTSGNGLDLDNSAVVMGCYIHNIGGVGLQSNSSFIYNNYFQNGANDFTTALQSAGQLGYFTFNLINLEGNGNSSNGIMYRIGDTVQNNSIWSAAGTGHGILMNGASREESVVLNNIIEGFSGVSGIGIDLPSGSFDLYGGNAVFNNATNFNIVGQIRLDLGDNETLSASPFADPASGDFAVDTSVRATALPLTFNGASTDQALDKGAAQRVEPAAGGGLRLAGHGGLAA